MPATPNHYGTGRRKTATARVYLKPGSGKITVNDRSLDEFFGRETGRMIVRQPLDAVKLHTQFDITVQVDGGGITGQAGAISQGIARALKSMFGLGTEPPPEGDSAAGMAKKLRDSGFLTRDGRMKERKKYGRKGARKKFQFSKR